MLKRIKKYFENRDKRIELLNDLRILNEAFYLIEYYYRSEDRTDDVDAITDKNGTTLKNIIKKIKTEISVKLAEIMTNEDED
ncbi:MAG: hypothetical protein WC942_09440 [Clostridia bacterium]|jgi:hypothetical protein